MKIIKLANALKDMERVELAKAIREGKIIIYPTDTLYGIGCNAKNSESVEKILKAKGRGHDKPLSIIAPSKEWIVENIKITSNNLKFIDNLFPGPYTVILKAKIKIPFVVSKEGKIGTRIPRNEFCDFIRSQGFPFVTTSVNLSEENPVYSINDIPEQIKQIADYVIDAGEIKGHASRVYDISGKSLEILRW
ncbi:MAG: L-threonylcarbamoyladenylate synthase [Candidatus Aenigmarchaeota archaeon]